MLYMRPDLARRYNHRLWLTESLPFGSQIPVTADQSVRAEWTRNRDGLSPPDSLGRPRDDSRGRDGSFPQPDSRGPEQQHATRRCDGHERGGGARQPPAGYGERDDGEQVAHRGRAQDGRPANVLDAVVGVLVGQR